MARKSNPWAAVHKAYRAAYRVNRALTTGRVIASGNPKRIERLFVRRLLYKMFARLVNKALR